MLHNWCCCLKYRLSSVILRRVITTSPLTPHRAQGASVSSIRPEYLMSPHDYRSWARLHDPERQVTQTTFTQQQHQPTTTPGTAAKCSASNFSFETLNSLESLKESSHVTLHNDIFESISKRAWTDLLLQIYKVRCGVSGCNCAILIVIYNLIPSLYSSFLSS